MHGRNGKPWDDHELEIMNRYQQVDEEGDFSTYKTQLRMTIQTDEPLSEGKGFEVKVLSHAAKNEREKEFITNPIFPTKLSGEWALWGVDEGFADMLTGMVEALKPRVLLETGTNRGRSARAITEGLKRNGGGMLYTIDQLDHEIKESGAIPEDQCNYVQQIIGPTPDVFEWPDLAEIGNIEFAFLDGDHTAGGVLEELSFIEEHRATHCTVLVDNCMDESWPELQDLFADYDAYPCVILPTMTGTALIQMSH